MNRQLRIIVAARVMVVALAIVLSSVRFSVAVEAIDVDPALRMRPPAFQTRTHFAEPLMATAPTTLVEDRVFARTLARYDRRRRVDDLSALRKYLARFPHSGWRVSRSSILAWNTNITVTSPGRSTPGRVRGVRANRSADLTLRRSLIALSVNWRCCTPNWDTLIASRRCLMKSAIGQSRTPAGSGCRRRARRFGLCRMTQSMSICVRPACAKFPDDRERRDVRAG